MNLNALYDSGSVRRFHTVADYSGAVQQTVADHSWGVALILLELCRRRKLEPTGALLRAAVLHDAEEAHTGDIPATTKWRFPALAAEATRAEVSVREELGIECTDITAEEGLALKWADGLELYAHAQRRARDGATAYARIAANIRLFMQSNLPQWPAAVQMLEELTLG